MASAPERSGCLLRLVPLLLLLLGGFGLSVLAERVEWSRSPGPALAPEAQANPNDFLLTPSRDSGLFTQLEAGDQAWIPRAQPIPGGGTRYVYKKRPEDQPLTVDQIKALMRHPPSFDAERQAIRALLSALRTSGVTVLLGPPRKQGAAGEWDPARAVLRIRPDIPAKGSREFARVLNHEAIHVAQSCRHGALTASPRPLGLSRMVTESARRHLQEPLYRQATPLERALEEEAYANQELLQLGVQLITAHCST